MFKLIILLSFFAIDLGASDDYDSPEISSVIVGGNDADITSYPYQVSLHINKKFVCGGSILSTTHIVTAAHCVSSYPDDIKKKVPYEIRAGSTLQKDGGVLIPLKDVHYHPKYDAVKTDYDVAIGELSTPLTYSDKIKPIKIATATPDDGKMVEASGWGCIQEICEMVDELQAVEVPMVNRKTCETNYQKYLKITPRMICAGVVGKDACQGDSGGPLALNRDTLVGLASTGVGCGRKDLPGIYTNVVDPEVREFIKKHSNV